MSKLLKPFYGTGVAMVTPFTSSGEVDLGSLKKLIEYLLGNGIDYLVVLGTTGESATLSSREKQAIFAFVAEVVNGRAPLVAGVGGNHTAEVTQHLKEFTFDGYAAILSVSPYYNKPTQEGIYRHYMELAAHSPHPIIIYNVPGRTGSNVQAVTTLKLANEGGSAFLGVKEASGDLEQICKILHSRPKDFKVISGDDFLTLPILACGGDGVISVLGNVVPGAFSGMVRQALEGDFTSARKTHLELQEITEYLFAEGNPGGAKAALAHLGLMGNHLRLPLAPVSSALEKKLEKALGALEVTA